jgi:hypothetical protein
MKEILEEKLDKIVSKEPSKFWAESDERFKNKETLEETIERLFRHYPESIDYIKAFVNGAKWQQERSYSEEEVLNIIQLFNDDFNMIQDTVPKWFEQFKKK